MFGVTAKASLSRSFCSTATLRVDAVRLSHVHTLPEREVKSSFALYPPLHLHLSVYAHRPRTNSTALRKEWEAKIDEGNGTS